MTSWNNRTKEKRDDEQCHPKRSDVANPYRLVGTCNLEGGSLPKESLGKVAKLPELDFGLLGILLLLDHNLPQLVFLVFHLLKYLGVPDIGGSMN